MVITVSHEAEMSPNAFLSINIIFLKSCLTLCDPVDYSPPGSSIHEILQARALEWVAISSSRESSRPCSWPQASHTVGRHLPTEPTGKSQVLCWTNRVEIPHVQGQRNPSKMVGAGAAVRRYPMSKSKREAPEQDPVSPSVSLSHQEVFISLLSFSIRGQTPKVTITES